MQLRAVPDATREVLFQLGAEREAWQAERGAWKAERDALQAEREAWLQQQSAQGEELQRQPSVGMKDGR